MMVVTPVEYRALLRFDLCAFIERCFYLLNPQTRFLMNWHIEVLAAKLMGCYEGRIRRLIINVPPRHLKSLSSSIAFIAWCLGKNPAMQIICASYAQGLSDKLARDCRTVMNSDWYRATFRTRLSPQKQSVDEFVTTAEGYRLATSVGGVLTGRGGDLIVIDDPLKPDEALSDVRRKWANDWYDNTLYSRLNNKETSRIILIMQRLHEDDLVAHVLAQEPWEVVSFPAIAEHAEEHVISAPYGTSRFTRRFGDVLHPERESCETLGHIRQTLGEYNFASQYQQTPAPLGGGLIKAAWFQSYAPNELPNRFDQIVQSWDTANKVTELSDYSVCTTWGIKERRIYLLHVLRRRMEYPDLKRAVREQARAHRATVVLIEDRASGTQLIQELKADGLDAATRYEPEHDKVMRLHAQTATIESGTVHLPREAPWLADYLHELTTFPNAKHDDQADSTSQALAWIKHSSANPAITDFYRQEYARGLHGTGLSTNVIAQEVNATSEEVQSWLANDDVNELSDAYEEIQRDLRGESRCAACGGKITGTAVEDNGRRYHKECWKGSPFWLPRGQ